MMNIVKRIDQYDSSNIFFCEPIKNNIIDQSNFIRIIYSNNLFSLNGVYLFINLNDVTSDKYYTKHKCMFNVSENKEVIENIKNIEEEILNKYNVLDKTRQFKIYDQLKNGSFKLFNEVGSKNTCSFVLKISGIWETQSNYGLTYKFIKINS